MDVVWWIVGALLGIALGPLLLAGVGRTAQNLTYSGPALRRRNRQQGRR